jgi:hypothetical protein
MIEVHCEKCGKRFLVKDDMQGKRGKCPCGNAINIPVALGGAVELTFAEPLQPKRPVLAFLSLILGGAGLAAAFLGCLIYLILWGTLEDFEKIGVIGGLESPGGGKLVLPVVLNYLGLLLAIAAIVLGIISVAQDRRWRGPIKGFALASIGLVLLLGFWIWTVSRDYRNYGGDIAENPAKGFKIRKDVFDDFLDNPQQPKPDKPGSITGYLGISPDFKTYASRSSGRISIADFETRNNLLSLPWEFDWGTPSSVRFGGNRIAVASQRNVKVFSRNDGEITHNFRGQISSISISQNGKRLVVLEFQSGAGFHVLIHDLDKRDNAKDFRIGQNGTSLMGVSRNFAAAYESMSNEVSVFEIEDGRQINKYKATTVSGMKPKSSGFGSSFLKCLAISPDGKTLAVGIEDRIKTYSLDSEKIGTLDGHIDDVTCLAFYPDKARLLSGSKDKTIRTWNLENAKQVKVMKSLPLVPNDLRISSDGNSALYSNGGMAELIRLQE